MTDADMDKLEAPTDAQIDHAIRQTEYKYFGDYELSEEQSLAVETLVRAASALSAARASARRDAEEIERLRIAIEGEKLNYDGAISDLESVLQVLARRINGEKDLDSARTWLELNYPDFAASALTARAAHTGEG